ncbi:uncharacterized protein PGTG_03624 [Puccinia graminis f. sp. tritici CRL 75-36-700-3]|uniref:Vesicular-fusion protein SEC18 n=1 Tax=Puccinia graminis f. sp. tritici (strain CRL 75-36-700-3 / race SCCL) TaxID=418459 RepID=E3K043_PUCGT|nr:uncharacterized protein PGTG_03624 [Puccinia graminis f. sp. tritici CRL 75-36-700-3]EFP77668.1 hypothetical protein PGTG_03624 [Puccinia graminis f. sp. tritici CRL 75-36-700-3]
MQVNLDDFLNALDEVKPAFGVAEEELKSVIQNGINKFSPPIDEIHHDGKLFVEQVRMSTWTPLVSVLIHGPPGSGKTALAASIAQASDFPFIKLIAPKNMVHWRPWAALIFVNGDVLGTASRPRDISGAMASLGCTDFSEVPWVCIGSEVARGWKRAAAAAESAGPPYFVPCATLRSGFELTRSIRAAGADFDSGQYQQQPATSSTISRLPISSAVFDRICDASTTGKWFLSSQKFY